MSSIQSGCPRHAPILRVFVLFVLIALSTLRAQASTLVSNLGEAQAGNLNPLYGQWYATAFVTDGDAYPLEAVTFSIDPFQFPQESVSFARIYADDGAGAPGALLIELSNPAGLNFGPAGDYLFSAAGTVTLDPDTRYWVSLGSQVPPPGTADQRAYWRYTSSTSTSGPGSMAGGSYFSSDQGASWNLIGPSWNPIFQVHVTAPTAAPGIRATPISLHQNTPNPFNPRTVIRYELPVDGLQTSLRIYDLRGSLVRTLVDGAQPAGMNRASWDGRDESGRTVASGSYFYRLTVGGQSQTKKLMLLK